MIILSAEVVRSWHRRITAKKNIAAGLSLGQLIFPDGSESGSRRTAFPQIAKKLGRRMHFRRSSFSTQPNTAKEDVS